MKKGKKKLANNALSPTTVSIMTLVNSRSAVFVYGLADQKRFVLKKLIRIARCFKVILGNGKVIFSILNILFTGREMSDMATLV